MLPIDDESYRRDTLLYAAKKWMDDVINMDLHYIRSLYTLVLIMLTGVSHDETAHLSLVSSTPLFPDLIYT